MSCEFIKQVALYADDEMDRADQEKMAAHIPGCMECTSTLANHLDLKKAVRVSGKSFSAPPDLHAAIFRQIHQDQTPQRQGVSAWWKWISAPVTAVLLAAVVLLSLPHTGSKDKEDALLAELVDQHVVALSSANPVDVVSETRHTVKPWFQGKLPYTFNLPEVEGTPYKLVGGKLTYARQTAGAELLYMAGQHKVSVFIYQANSRQEKPLHKFRELSFNCTHWQQNGLEFYMLTDAQDEADRLATMLQEVNRS